MENTKITFQKVCRNVQTTVEMTYETYIFGQKHVSVSKWHCFEIVCVEVTGSPQNYTHYVLW